MHALLVFLNFPAGTLDSESKLDAVFELEEVLKQTLETSGAGNFDGNEFCESPDETSVTFFIYGPDVDTLYETIVPILLKLPPLSGSYVTKRFGDIGAKETRIALE